MEAVIDDITEKLIPKSSFAKTIKITGNKLWQIRYNS